MNKLIEALVKIERLLRKWGLSRDDWMLAGKDAFILQGYRFDFGHNLDFFINRLKLPWKEKEDFQAMPKRNSKELDEYIKCTEKIGFGIHLIPLPQGKLTVKEIKKSVLYKLPNQKEVRLYKPKAEVKTFEYLLLKKCNLKKFDIRFIVKNLTHLKDIKKEAARKKQRDLVRLCQDSIKKVAKHYSIK